MSDVLKPPNPLERDFQQQLLAAKQNYADADALAQSSGVNANDIRDAQSQAAELLRFQGNAAGLNMNGYGSDVSFEDAYKNLASQRAREITQALQGQYSMNSDQYYERKYDEALMRGLSRNQAKRLAGAQAREYQANRVAYLQGAYNSYGRDGRVTNDYGNQFLAMMAMENPTLANFYAQVYPNQKEAFTRDNQLEDKVLDQANVLEKLGIVQKYEQENMAQRHNYNEIAADNAHRRSQENYQYQSDVNFFDARRRAEFAQALNAVEEKNPARITTWLAEGEKLAEIQGLTGKEAETAAAQYVILQALNDLNKNNKGNNKGNGGNSQGERKLSEKVMGIYNTAENLYRAAKLNPTDETIAAFEDHINSEEAKTLPSDLYDLNQDLLWVLKGLKYKLANDDNNAAACWARIKNQQVFEREVPNEKRKQ